MIEILTGDARELAPHFAPACDALITDPPYSARVHAKAVSVNPGGHETHTRARGLGFAHLSPALRRSIAALAPLVSGWSCVFSDLEGAAAWRISLQAAGAEYVRAVPWVRWSQPQTTGDRPGSGAEMVTIAHRGGGKAWGGPGGLTHFAAASLRGGGKFATEKPLDDALSLVAWFCPRGGAVLDPCAGAGTTGRAAQLLGRDAVLIELDPATAARARARLASPLTPGEVERVQRWLAAQERWIAAACPTGPRGDERLAWMRADLETVRAALGA